MSRSPFDFVNDVTCKAAYDPTGYEQNAWMVDNIFSQDEKLVFIADEVNRLQHVPANMRYDFYYYLLPSGKRYIKYILSKKEKDTKNDDKIQEICDELKVNKARAKEYLDILHRKGYK